MRGRGREDPGWEEGEGEKGARSDMEKQKSSQERELLTDESDQNSPGNGPCGRMVVI